MAGPPRTRTGVPQQPFRAIVSQRWGRLYGVLPQTVTVTVAGIGADGWAGLSPRSQAAIEQAGVVVGGPRLLALLPSAVAARRIPLPQPLLPGLPELVASHVPAGLVVLASGDPMFYGIGSTLDAALRRRTRFCAAASVVGVAGGGPARLAG